MFESLTTELTTSRKTDIDLSFTAFIQNTLQRLSVMKTLVQ